MAMLMGNGPRFRIPSNPVPQPRGNRFIALFSTRKGPAKAGFRLRTSAPAPFLRQSRSFPELRTHLSPNRRKNDFLEVVRRADQRELRSHPRLAAQPEPSEPRVLDLTEHRLHDCIHSSFVGRRGRGGVVDAGRTERSS